MNPFWDQWANKVCEAASTELRGCPLVQTLLKRMKKCRKLECPPNSHQAELTTSPKLHHCCLRSCPATSPAPRFSHVSTPASAHTWPPHILHGVSVCQYFFNCLSVSCPWTDFLPLLCALVPHLSEGSNTCLLASQ